MNQIYQLNLIVSYMIMYYQNMMYI